MPAIHGFETLSLRRAGLLSLAIVLAAAVGAVTSIVSADVEMHKVTVQVNSSTDDAYDVPGGTHWPGYSDTDKIVHAGRPNQDAISYGGWRWTDLDIPAGAIIVEAYVELSQESWGWTVETSLALEDNPDPDTFSEQNSPADRWEEPHVNWTWDKQAPGSWTQTPDLTNALQKLVDKHDGVQGVVLLESGEPAGSFRSHTWAANDLDPTRAAKLHVKFTVEIPEQNEPVTIWSQVDGSANDAYDVPGDTQWPGYSHTDRVVYAGRPNREAISYGGWRWTDLNIPADAEIVEAYVELNQENLGWTVETSLALEDDPAPDEFSEQNSPADRWVEPQVNWTWNRQAHGSWDRTPDLTRLLQKLVDQHDGVESVVLLESGRPAPDFKSHTWATFDLEPTRAAKLHVTFIPRGGEPTPEADLAVLEINVSAPSEVQVDDTLPINTLSEIVNLGPDGPVLARVSSFLSTNKDCQPSIEVTEEMLSLALGPILVFTGLAEPEEVTTPHVFLAVPGATEIGIEFTLATPLEVGESTVLDNAWQITCGSPSMHQIGFETFIEVAKENPDQGFVVPDDGNNGLFELTEFIVFGEADIEAVSVAFGEFPEFAEVGETVDVPAIEVIRNNGPDGPVEVEVIANLSAGEFEPEVVITQELLDIAGGEIQVALLFGDGSFDEFTVSEPAEFSAGPAGVAGFNFVVRLGAGDELEIPELFRVTVTEPDVLMLQLDKQVFGIHVADSNEDNNFLFVEAPFGTPTPSDTDVAIVSFEVEAPPEVQINEPFEVNTFEEITNLGPDGPVHTVVSQFLFPSPDCLASAVITEELLALAGGTVSIQLDGVLTEYTEPITVTAPLGSVHIGFIFGVPVNVDEVVAIAEQWVIECENTSSHGFFVETFIDPIGVNDPNPSNNEQSLQFNVAVIGEADVEVVSVEFGEFPEIAEVGETVDVPATEVIRNNGPDGPVEIEVIANFNAGGFAPTVVVTQELLEIAGGELEVGLAFGDGSSDAFQVSEPSEFTAGPAGTAGFNFVVRLGVGEELEIPELFRVTVTEPDALILRLDKQVFGIHVVDSNEDNNFLFVEAPFGTPTPSDADVAILSLEVEAPQEVQIGEPFQVNAFETITNLGPDGPVDAVVGPNLFPPPDCLVSAVITEELLALAGGTLSVVIDGVFTDFTEPGVMPAPLGTEHIGFNFVVGIEVGEVLSIAEGWIVECANTSNHDFFVGKFVNALGVNDPDPSNDEMAVQFDVAVMGEADVEVVSVAFGTLPPVIPIDENFDVPVTAVVRNNGPDGPVEVETDIRFIPFGFPSSVHVTQELLDLSRGQVIVTFRFADDSFSEVQVTEPGDFFMEAGGGFLGLILMVPLDAGEELAIDALFDVEITEPGAHQLLLQSNVVGIHAVDADPENDEQELIIEIDVPPGPTDLSVEKIASLDEVTSGQTIDFTVTVNNNGTYDALAVTVTDTLPAGMSLISTSGCVEDPSGVPTCSLGKIPAGGSASYTITVGVSQLGSGILVNTVEVSAENADPVTENNTATASVTVLAANVAPFANAGGPYSVDEGSTVTLDGSGSSDSDGLIVLYAWDFDGDTVTDATGVSPLFDASALDGLIEITVNLTVTDDDGATNAASAVVTVINVAPSVFATGDTIDEGDTATLSVTFTDPAPGDTHTATIDWGDGSGIESLGAVTSPFSPTHVYTDDEVFNVTVTVTDDDGGIGSDTTTITVNNVAPTAALGNNGPVAEGTQASVSFTAQSDPSSDDTTAGFIYSYDFGNTGTFDVIGSAVPTALVPLSLTEDGDAAVDVRGRIEDKDGGFNDVITSVVVDNVAPFVVATGDTVDLGNQSAVSVSFSDPGALDVHTATVNWGDGGAVEDLGTVTSPFNAAHAYARSGAFSVTVTVTDNDGDSGVDSTVANVSTVPAISLALADTDLVGVSRSATVVVTLNTPAPAGGTTVTVTSDDTGLLAVSAPGTTFIPEGETAGQVTVDGVSEGSTTLRGNSTGYAEGTLLVGVTLNLISLPTTLNVPLGTSVDFPVTIAPEPAPAGGVTISIVSSDPGTVQVLTPTVFIPEGAVSANGTVFGAAIGSANVNGSNPQYAADNSDVSTTAAFNIVQSSLTINSSFRSTITIRLESDGSPTAAPAPGVDVILTPGDPDCVSAVSPVTIPTGLVDITSAVSYGGIASVPCTTTLTANGGGITPDVINVTVNAAPGITVGAVTIGSGLIYPFSQFASLAASNHGGVTIHIESSDPTLVLISPDATTPATASMDVFVPSGSTSVAFRSHALEGVTGTATLTASAPGFNNGTASTVVVQPAIMISGLIANTTSLSPDDSFAVFTGVPTAGNTTLNQFQAIRPGGAAVTATVTNSDSTVGQLVTTGLTAQLVTVEIPVGAAQSANSVAAGGVVFDPIDGGTTTISASVPGFISTTAASDTTNVTTPGITVNVATIGSGLIYPFSQFVTLGASQHGGVTVHIESSDPTLVLISPDATTPATASMDVFLPNGSTSVAFRSHALEGVTGTATLTASAPGFNNGTASTVVVQPAIMISGLIANTTSLSPDDSFAVFTGVPTAGNTTLNQFQSIRPGGAAVIATVINSDSTVGQLVTTGLTAQLVTVEIPVGAAQSANSVAAGGVAFDPIDGGTTTVSASIPGFISTTAASDSTNVTTPGITVDAATVGSGLIYPFNQFVLLAASNHGGVTVHIESSDPTLVLISPDATTAATASMDVFLPNGSISVAFRSHALEGVTGTATLTASATGFSNGTASAVVVQPAIMISGLIANTTTLSPDDSFAVFTGVPTAGNTTLNQLQAIRPGGAAGIATVINTASGVGRLVTTGLTAQLVTVEIPLGEAQSADSVAAGGVAFETLTTGSTTISASVPGFISTTAASADITVTTPGITVGATTVGSGLIFPFNQFVTLGASQHGGVTIHIESSNSSVALVSSDDVTVGTEFIDVFVPNGSTSVPFRTHGLEGATGTVTITASASGFTDGTASATVVQPALMITGLPTSKTTLSSDDPFVVFIGVPTAGNTTLNQFQVIRPGGTALTITITNSDGAVAQLVTTAFTGQSVTVEIPAGAAQSASSVAAGGVAFDSLGSGSTTVEATIPGFITTTAGTITITVTGGVP